ncbi:hypothetical protein [Paenirhodobacter populi]|uniref:hypothetical protein n=1 Tax=Paenirhodobacter populi TaxID=2306993 RepID=UPI0013E2EC24|nr:hypothetical protein [Sinirhodobacter populi]
MADDWRLLADKERIQQVLIQHVSVMLALMSTPSFRRPVRPGNAFPDIPADGAVALPH